jgi:hypothetical protein
MAAEAALARGPRPRRGGLPPRWSARKCGFATLCLLVCQLLPATGWSQAHVNARRSNTGSIRHNTATGVTRATTTTTGTRYNGSVRYSRRYPYNAYYQPYWGNAYAYPRDVQPDQGFPAPRPAVPEYTPREETAGERRQREQQAAQDDRVIEQRNVDQERQASLHSRLWENPREYFDSGGGELEPGLALKTLPSQPEPVDVEGHSYYLFDHTFYDKQFYAGEVVYVVVSPPLGAVVNSVSPSCGTMGTGDKTYRICGSTWYLVWDTGYVVVDGPQ